MLTVPSFSFVDRFLLQKVLDATGQMPIQVKLDSGLAASPPGVSPIATVHIHDRRALAGLVLNPEISFGDSYSEGRIEVEGDSGRIPGITLSIAHHRLGEKLVYAVGFRVAAADAGEWTAGLAQEYSPSLRSDH